MISQNKETELAFNFLQYTDRNLFLTGQAGTGKTTFLKSLASRLNKRFVILAPTGVAALNAGGVTVHSFFQLPFHAILPGNKFETRKFSKQKINLIRSLDLIIIDEVSMVRCDVIDGVDRVLKTLRRDTKNRPFGGVQVLMIGDLNQLPPIATEEDEMMLRPYYNNFYFFSSNALKQSNYITISLKHIYRQEDKTFINILNNVRDKKTTPQDIEILNRCYKKDILNEVPENYIVLCTHNIQADKINVAKINALKGEDKLYKAEINGIFPDNTYPNSEKLHLKVGAQVMFLKNDYESIGKKKYYNGKIGVITYLDDEFVKVKCPDDEDEIFVQRYTWTNFEYTMKKDTKELTLKEKGTFSQFPLKLAWAITIHKSQGLTFDKAIINSNQAFSHGQVYVALSRCRSLEGMILSEPFNYSSVILDANVRYFNDRVLSSLPDEGVLQLSKDNYIIDTLNSVFDFSDLSSEIKRLKSFSAASLYRLYPELFKNISSEIDKYQTDIEIVASKFNNYFSVIENKNIASEEKIRLLKERCLKAKDYFLEKLSYLNELVLSLVDVEFDNNEDNNKLSEITVRISVEKEVKFRLLNFLSEKEFDVVEFLKYRNLILAKGTDIELTSINVKKPKAKSNHTKNSTKEENLNTDIKNRELFDALKSWRKETALDLNISEYTILSQLTMMNIANLCPKTMEDLLNIKGLGKKKAEAYGNEILEIVEEYFPY